MQLVFLICWSSIKKDKRTYQIRIVIVLLALGPFAERRHLEKRGDWRLSDYACFFASQETACFKVKVFVALQGEANLLVVLLFPLSKSPCPGEGC